jgi:hypothetical protein
MMITGAHRTSRIMALAIPVLMISGIANAGHKLHREDRKTVAVSGQRVIVVSNSRGKTIVVGGQDAKQIKVLASKWVKAKDEKTAQRIMDALDFEVEAGEKVIKLVAKHPESSTVDKSLWSMIQGGRHAAFIDFTVEVPDNFEVHTSTTSGDVQVTNIRGPASINATSGNVLLREIGGPTVVELTSGDVRAEDVGGAVQIEASSGNAVVRRVKGQLVVQATSGNVEAFEVGGDAVVHLISGDLVLRGCLGNVNFSTSHGSAAIEDVLGGVNATSSSGNLDVVIVPVGDKEFYFNTSSGNVVLRYLAADDYGFLLDVNTCTGSIRGDLEITKLDEVTRRKLKGVVGNGKARVVIETASGDVSISERTEKVDNK